MGINRRRISVILAAIIGSLVFTGYSLWSVNYYPPNLFAGLKAKILPGGREVLVTGHVMGSMFCVGTLAHLQKGEELNVRMRYRFICPSQRSGDFAIRIKAAAPLRRVTYGNERTEILLLTNQDNH